MHVPYIYTYICMSNWLVMQWFESKFFNFNFCYFNHEINTHIHTHTQAKNGLKFEHAYHWKYACCHYLLFLLLVFLFFFSFCNPIIVVILFSVRLGLYFNRLLLLSFFLRVCVCVWLTVVLMLPACVCVSIF
jgi:hypothetical protein